MAIVRQKNKNHTVYVGDLASSVTETQFRDLFEQAGQILSLKLCQDRGYGYVNYGDRQHAINAVKLFKFESVAGKSIRVMLLNRDPQIRKSECADVFIKNLAPSVDNKALYEVFAQFGTILSCKVATDDNGHSKGFGFVQFQKEEAAKNVINKMNGTVIKDQEVFVGPFIFKHKREYQRREQLQATVYVKNLSEKVVRSDLERIFGKYGKITGAVVATDEHGHSKGFGYVIFGSRYNARTAINKLKGHSHDDKTWYVSFVESKSEREEKLKEEFEEKRRIRRIKLRPANLYVKNLDDSINDEKLKEFFSEFGTITSCKVMLDSKEKSKGFGFVAFSDPKDATKAAKQMKAKVVGEKKLYVGVAQPKEERKYSYEVRRAKIFYEKRKLKEEASDPSSDAEKNPAVVAAAPC